MSLRALGLAVVGVASSAIAVYVGMAGRTGMTPSPIAVYLGFGGRNGVTSRPWAGLVFAVTDDDSRLAVSEKTPSSPSSRVLRIADSGSGRSRLISGLPSLNELRWDRGGRRLVGYWFSAELKRAGVGVVDSRTGRFQKLTSSGEGQTSATNPAWSPTGKWIAFERQERVGGGPIYEDNLFVMAPSGRKPVRVNSADILHCEHGFWGWHATEDTLFFIQRSVNATRNHTGPDELCAVTFSEPGRRAMRRVRLDALSPMENVARIHVVPSPGRGRVLLWVERVRGDNAAWVANMSTGALSRLGLSNEAESSPWPLQVLADGRLAILRLREINPSSTNGLQPAGVVVADMGTGQETASLSLPRYSWAWAFEVTPAGRFLYWYDVDAGKS